MGRRKNIAALGYHIERIILCDVALNRDGKGSSSGAGDQGARRNRAGGRRTTAATQIYGAVVSVGCGE